MWCITYGLLEVNVRNINKKGEQDGLLSWQLYSTIVFVPPMYWPETQSSFADLACVVSIILLHPADFVITLDALSFDLSILKASDNNRIKNFIRKHIVAKLNNLPTV